MFPTAKTHTPEPNPRYGGGKVHRNLNLPVTVAGVQTTKNCDALTDIQVIYCTITARNAAHTAYQGYIWAKYQGRNIGINVFDQEALRVVAGLRWGQIISVVGTLNLGTPRPTPNGNVLSNQYFNAEVVQAGPMGQITSTDRPSEEQQVCQMRPFTERRARTNFMQIPGVAMPTGEAPQVYANPAQAAATPFTGIPVTASAQVNANQSGNGADDAPF